MAAESPSWTEDEDQPWDDTEIEFDDDFSSPVTVSKNKGHISKSDLDQPSNAIAHDEKSDKDTRNTSDTMTTSDKRAHTGSDADFTKPISRVVEPTKEVDPMAERTESQETRNPDPISNNKEKDTPTDSAPSNGQPVEQPVVPEKHPEVTNGTLNQRVLAQAAPSFVDSNVLDSSDEEVHEEPAVEDKAVVKSFPEEPSTGLVHNGDLITKKDELEANIIPTVIEDEIPSSAHVEPLHSIAAETVESAAQTQALDELVVPSQSTEEPIESLDRIETNEKLIEEEALEVAEPELEQIPRDYHQEYASHSQYDLIARIEALESQLEETEEERDKFKDQYEGFLGKISSMKAVFQNYKETQEELALVKSGLAQAYEDLSASDCRAEELEAEVQTLSERCTQLEEKNTEVTTENERLIQKFASLNTESSDLNNECDRLSLQLTTMQREFQLREDSLQDEKYNLENEVSKLSKRLSEQKAAFSELEVAKEELTMTKKNLELVIEELKGSIEEKDQALVDANTKVSVENKLSQARLEEMEAHIKSAEEQTTQLQQEIQRLQELNGSLEQQKEALAAEIQRYKTENERIAALEEDVQSKQVIVGKLRHEAIILNEHLTKSLSMLRKQLDDGEGSVDKELISNLFINFLQLPRGDTKKFEALQLISSFLNWDDLRKIQAGLTNRGASERGDEPKPGRLSFISLWTDFLDKESTKK